MKRSQAFTLLVQVLWLIFHLYSWAFVPQNQVTMSLLLCGTALLSVHVALWEQTLGY